MSDSETEDLSLMSHRVKNKECKNWNMLYIFIILLLDFYQSATKRHCLQSPSCAIGRWLGDSLTQNLKDPIAVYWPRHSRKFVEEICIYNKLWKRHV